MGRFRRFVDKMEIKDIHLHRRNYTWSNQRRNPTLEKLDRVLVSVDWEAQAPNCFLQALSSNISDHSPVLLSTNAGFQGKPHFHFESFWPKLPDYQQAVQRGWHSDIPISDPFRRLDGLLLNVAKELQSWGEKRIGHIKLQILAAREIILQLDAVQEQRPLTEEEHELRKELKGKSLGLASLERTIACLRARINYLRDGDANTRLFHLQSSYRRKKKHIASLATESGTVHAHDEKADELFRHFQEILGTEVERGCSLDLGALGTPTAELSQLDASFTEEEMWSAMKALPAEKAPGPDDFTAEFYKSAWTIIKWDLLLALDAFNRLDRRGMHGLNNALITLLPKES